MPCIYLPDTFQLYTFHPRHHRLSCPAVAIPCSKSGTGCPASHSMTFQSWMLSDPSSRSPRNQSGMKTSRSKRVNLKERRAKERKRRTKVLHLNLHTMSWLSIELPLYNSRRTISHIQPSCDGKDAKLPNLGDYIHSTNACNLNSSNNRRNMSNMNKVTRPMYMGCGAT
jgi:hypothetical protein